MEIQGSLRQVANLKSSKKRARQALKAREHNRPIMSGMKTQIKKVLTAVEEGKVEDAQTHLRLATSLIAKTKNTGMIHPKQAARRVQRLNAKVKQLVQAAA